MFNVQMWSTHSEVHLLQGLNVACHVWKIFDVAKLMLDQTYD